MALGRLIIILFVQALLTVIVAKYYCLLPTEENNSLSIQRISNNCICDEYFTLSNRSFMGDLRDTMILFCEGIHYLDSIWNISNTSNLALSSAQQDVVAVITCKASESGLYFTKILNITLDGLEFKYCGITNSANNENLHNRAALVFTRIGNLTLRRIIVQEPSTAGGFSLNNMNGNTLIKNSIFKNSRLSGNITSGNLISHGIFEFNLTTLIIWNSTFENNCYFLERKCSKDDRHFSAGLIIAIIFRHVEITLNHVTLRNNSGCRGGNIAILYFQNKGSMNWSSLVVVSNNSIIEGGFADVGGGVFVLMKLGMHTDNMTISDTEVVNNKAVLNGAGLFIKALEGLKHNGTSYVIILNCHFEENKMNQTYVNGGDAIQVTTFFVKGFKDQMRPQLKVSVTSSSFINHGIPGYQSSLITSGNAVLYIKNTPYFLLQDVNVTDNMCSGLTAIASNIILSGGVLISNNSAYCGAGILLCSDALLYFKKSTMLRVTNNNAKYTGGGINIESGCTLNNPACFFQFYSSFDDSITAIVEGNTAGYAGSNIFGGSIQTCYLIEPHHVPHHIFYKLFKVPNNSKTFNSSISSGPIRLHIKNYIENLKVSPGQTLRLKAVIYGQKEGVTPGRVYAHLNNSRVNLARGDFVQTLAKANNYLSYHIFSKVKNVIVTLDLSVSEGNVNPHVNTISLNLNITDCPFGLKLEKVNTMMACRCNYLKNVNSHTKGIKCSISNGPMISYSKELWIGGVCDQVECRRPLFIGMSIVCPQDYCKKKVRLMLDKQPLINNTVQCNFNRSGVLCGGCILGRSTILGSSECRLCSNYYLFFVIVFVLAGPILFFFISILNLTVSSGLLNGIVFYANIVQLYNFSIFRTNTSILKVFIAWLNLDFGISVCLFNGMTGFSKSLLQFIFPVYLWAISGIVILFSKKYELVAKLFGTNSTQVLATLILLSYTKLIRASADAIHFTRLLLPDVPYNHTYSIRWSVDGNMRFLHGKHLVIFIIGTLFGVLSVLYTLILLFIGHLPRISHWPFFSWIYKLKPFFDCYTGPLSDKGRFWVGLLLFARIFLLGAYSINISSAEASKLTATIITMFVLLLFLSLSSKGIYNNHFINILEMCSITNLRILFTGLLCSYHYSLDFIQTAFVLLSLITAFILSFIIVAYHAYQRFGCSNILMRISRRRISNVSSDNQGLQDEENVEASRSLETHLYDYRNELNLLLEDI